MIYNYEGVIGPQKSERSVITYKCKIRHGLSCSLHVHTYKWSTGGGICFFFFFTFEYKNTYIIKFRELYYLFVHKKISCLPMCRVLGFDQSLANLLMKLRK